MQQKCVFLETLRAQTEIFCADQQKLLSLLFVCYLSGCVESTIKEGSLTKLRQMCAAAPKVLRWSAEAPLGGFLSPRPTCEAPPLQRWSRWERNPGGSRHPSCYHTKQKVQINSWRRTAACLIWTLRELWLSSAARLSAHSLFNLDLLKLNCWKQK